jgi:hypothetical protein
MLKSSNIGTLLGAIGLIGGAMYAIKGGKNIAVFTIGFGVGGYLLGNAVSKFYTPSI